MKLMEESIKTQKASMEATVKALSETMQETIQSQVNAIKAQQVSIKESTMTELKETIKSQKEA
jgi:isocitrate dehydrogenase